MMAKWKRLVALIASLTLAMGIMGPVAVVNADQNYHTHPLVYQLATQQPHKLIAVIVQKADKTDAAEALVTTLGGSIKKNLSIINAFTAEMEANAALQLASSPSVRWVSLDAPVVRSAIITESVADNFDVRVYSNNNGTQPWIGDWVEVNDDNKVDGGKVRIDKSMLRLEDKVKGIYRVVGLQNALTASLKLQYRRESMNQALNYVDIQVSIDSGTTWLNLARLSGPANDPSLRPEVTYDLTPYITSNLAIRFLTASTMGGRLWVDNLRVEYALESSPPLPPPPPGGVSFSQTIADDLWSIPSSFENNSGTRNWRSGWLEFGESDGGFSGHVNLAPVFGTDRINLWEDNSDGVWNKSYGAWRKVDLTGATAAALSFTYRRALMENPDYASFEISTDGGNTWTEWLRLEAGNDDAFQTASFDISPFISANTAIRFITNFNQANASDSDYFQFDDITIQFNPPLLPMPPNTYLDTLGVPSVWQQGVTGAGITVALIDSGMWVDQDFMRLPTDYCRPGGCGTNRLMASYSFGQTPYTNDNYGHGTHVAGIIGGNGTKSGGLYKGIAPQVDFISLKVCDNYGMAYESDVVEAMQWVYENKDAPAYRIRIVNLSVNSTVAQSYHTSPIDAAAEILWFNGVVVIASAGNGSVGSYDTINAAPANDPFIITVGATDEAGTANRSDDFITAFSASGTTLDGFAKPDIVAPGKNIVSVLAKESWWRNEYPERFVENIYFRANGTSMAAPMVTGAVALLLQDEPNLTPDQVKYRLTSTASTLPGQAGDPRQYPYLNVLAAVNGSTTQSANTGVTASQLLWTDLEPVVWGSVAWNSVAWNSVAWNSVAWNSVAWNSVAWNSVAWNSVFFEP